MKKFVVFAAGLMSAASAMAQSQLPPNWTPPPEQSIPGAGRNGIRDFVASADDLVFLYGPNGRWYRVALSAPCLNIRQKLTLGYQTNVTGDFDKTSTLLVNGKPCHVVSVVDAPEGPLRRN